MNTSTKKTYILPQNYLVKSTKALNHLQDIVYLLDPRYRADDISSLSAQHTSYDLSHNPYTVGYVGLNKISQNDYSNVVIQALAHIEPIRDFLLALPNHPQYDILAHKYPLMSTFGLLVRRIWSSRLFRSHVSPHEFLQLVSLVSKRNFSITHQSTPKRFLVWLLNQLHCEAAKAMGKKRTAFSKAVQGEIEITTFPLTQTESENVVQFEAREGAKKTVGLKFWILSLSLGPASALKGHNDAISLVSIELLLLKYDGITTTSVSAAELRTYKLKSPGPPFLIMHVDRGLEGGQVRGNNSVVKYPMILDMAPYMDGSKDPIRYQLVSNTKHHHVAGEKVDRKDDQQQWSISLLADEKQSQWLHIHDLEVSRTDGEFLFLDESYILVWKRCT